MDENLVSVVKAGSLAEAAVASVSAIVRRRIMRQKMPVYCRKVCGLVMKGGGRRPISAPEMPEYLSRYPSC